MLSGLDIVYFSEKYRLIGNLEEIIYDVQPASIDLRVKEVRGPISYLYTSMDIKRYKKLPKMDITDCCVLERGKWYYILADIEINANLLEKLGLYLVVCGKSSLARIFTIIRGLFPEGLDIGRSKNIILAVKPEIFNILIKEDYSIAQVRFQTKSEILSNEEMLKIYLKEYFVAIDNPNPINIGKVKYHDPRKYFTKIESPFSEVYLESGRGYLFRTSDLISLSNNVGLLELALSPYIHSTSHPNAGFGDPGWGSYGNKRRDLLEKILEQISSLKNILKRDVFLDYLDKIEKKTEEELKDTPKTGGVYWVLEMVPHENLLINSSVRVRMLKLPWGLSYIGPLYGITNSHYQDQNKIKLAKFFREW